MNTLSLAGQSQCRLLVIIIITIIVIRSSSSFSSSFSFSLISSSSSSLVQIASNTLDRFKSANCQRGLSRPARPRKARFAERRKLRAQLERNSARTNCRSFCSYFATGARYQRRKLVHTSCPRKEEEACCSIERMRLVHSPAGARLTNAMKPEWITPGQPASCWYRICRQSNWQLHRLLIYRPPAATSN